VDVSADGSSPLLESLLAGARKGDGLVVFLTGAGISAESGIPTFRGSEGFWTIGSVHHTPMEMATSSMFRRAPHEVWAWYLYRLGVCLSCAPNAAHHAIVRVEQRLGDRMGLVTQNVDGLHQRAGSTEARTYAIHGSIRKARCASDRCSAGLCDLPELGAHPRGAPLSTSERAAVTCATCGGWLRPHVLWFDEYYEESHYRSTSALSLAARASLLIVVGTTGSTTLPVRIGMDCVRRGVPVIDVNIDDNPFSEMAAENGVILRQAATRAVPAMARLLLERRVKESRCPGRRPPT
jgi:NAD-dependent deacetylase